MQENLILEVDESRIMNPDSLIRDTVNSIRNLGDSLRKISSRPVLISTLAEACKSNGLPSKLEHLQELLASEGPDDFVRGLISLGIEDFTKALLIIWDTYSLYAMGHVLTSYEVPDALGINLVLLFGTLGHHVSFFPKLASLQSSSVINASLAEQVFNALSDNSSSQLADTRIPDLVANAMLHMLCSFDSFPPRTSTITRRYFRSAERNVAKVLSRQLPNFTSSISTYDAEGPRYTFGIGYGGGFPEVLPDGTLVRPVQAVSSKTSSSHPRSVSGLSNSSSALLSASFWLLDRTIRRSSNDTSRVALATTLQEIIQAENSNKIGLSLALLRHQDNVWPLLVFSCLFQSVWSTGRILLFSSQPRSTSDERIIDIMLPAMVLRVLDKEVCPIQLADALEGAIAVISLPGTVNFEILLRQMCSSDVTSALEGVVMCATYLRASGSFLMNPVLFPSCFQPSLSATSEMPSSNPSWIDALDAASIAAEAYPEDFPSSSLEFAKKIRRSLSILLDKGCTLLDCLLLLLHLTAGQSKYAVLRAGYLRALRYVPDAIGYDALSDNVVHGILEEPCRYLGAQPTTSPDPDFRVRVIALSTWIYTVKRAISKNLERATSHAELLVKFGFTTLLESYVVTIDSNDELGALIMALSPTRKKEDPRVPVHTKGLCECAAFAVSEICLSRDKIYTLFETSDQIFDEPVLMAINKTFEKIRDVEVASDLTRRKQEALTKIINDATLRATVQLTSTSPKRKRVDY